MRSYRDRLQGDSGGAMLTVVLVGLILSGMGLALAKTSIANLGNAGRDRVSSGALGIAEAGVAEAITHLRGSGVNHICTACTSAWNVSTPATVTFSSGTAVVTIAEIQRYRPPQSRIGRYRIRSVGATNGSDPGKRTIEQEVDIEPFSFPLGVYTAAKVNLQGTVQIQQESFFSGECIDSRNKMTFVPGPNGSYVDPYNDIPAGAHSATYITDRNSSVCGTDLAAVRATDTLAVHRSNTCSETYWSDQSALGGPFVSGTCASRTGGKGDYGTAGSAFSMDVLEERYGFVPRGLTDDQFTALKAKAKAAGTWFPAGAAVTIPPVSLVPGSPGYNPVVYVENQTFNLGTEFNGYAWDLSDTACTQLHPSVLLIVENGGLKLGSSTKFTGNIFVPDSDVSFAGGAELVGTVFAKNLKFTGNGRMGLNECAAASTNGNLLSVKKTRFRELDQ
jgi:hypothetical protein